MGMAGTQWPITILLPYVEGMLHPRTEKWAEVYNVTKVELDKHDDEAYFRLLAKEWREPGDLVIVEQDMVPSPGIVEKMIYCRSSWCTSKYAIAGGNIINNGLGVVKFSGRTKHRYPGLIDRVGYLVDSEPGRSWRRLDTRVSYVMHALGYRPHDKHGIAEHLHDYSRG